MRAWFSCGQLLVLISGTILAVRTNLAIGSRFEFPSHARGLSTFLSSWLSGSSGCSATSGKRPSHSGPPNYFSDALADISHPALTLL